MDNFTFDDAAAISTNYYVLIRYRFLVSLRIFICLYAVTAYRRESRPRARRVASTAYDLHESRARPGPRPFMDLAAAKFIAIFGSRRPHQVDGDRAKP